MPSLWRIANDARRAARIQSAMKHPDRYAERRAKSYALRELGFWRMWRRFWRA
jgi:hypothetical protein